MFQTQEIAKDTTVINAMKRLVERTIHSFQFFVRLKYPFIHLLLFHFCN